MHLLLSHRVAIVTVACFTFAAVSGGQPLPAPEDRAPDPVGAPVQSVCEFVLQDGRLEVKTHHALTDQQETALVSDLDGESHLSHRPLVFEFGNRWVDRSGDEPAEMSISVERRDAGLRVEQRRKVGTELRTILLLQAYTDDFFGLKTGEVRLSSSTVRDRRRVDQSTESAKNLTALRVAHPERFAELVPALLRLKATAVIRADEVIARQVLLPQPSDEQLRPQVTRLVEQLNDDDFARRTAARSELVELGPAALRLASTIDATSLSSEQQLAIEQMLRTQRVLSAAELVRLANDAQFVLDCLYVDDPAIRRHALDQLTQLLGERAAIDHDADLPQRALQVERVRAGLPAPKADAPDGEVHGER